jgi:hypothetical protein
MTYVYTENDRMSGEDFLNVFAKLWEEYSILWIVTSAIIGGLITHFFKFIFEKYIPAWQLKKATRVSIQKYQLPLLQYGYAAENSILKVLKNTQINDNESNEDSHLRTLYFICAFFGWCQVLSKKSLLEYVQFGLVSSKAIETFGTHYNNVIRGISSPDYFLGLEENLNGAADTARVPSLAATAIGDLMNKDYGNLKILFPEVIGFREFVSGYKHNSEFREWFSYIENIFDYKTKSESDIKWNRLIILYTHIRVFTFFLEIRNESILLKMADYIKKILRISKRPYLVDLDGICERIHPTVKDRLHNELATLGYAIGYGIE